MMIDSSKITPRSRQSASVRGGASSRASMPPRVPVHIPVHTVPDPPSRTGGPSQRRTNRRRAGCLQGSVPGRGTSQRGSTVHQTWLPRKWVRVEPLPARHAAGTQSAGETSRPKVAMGPARVQQARRGTLGCRLRASLGRVAAPADTRVSSRRHKGIIPQTQGHHPSRREHKTLYPTAD